MGRGDERALGAWGAGSFLGPEVTGSASVSCLGTVTAAGAGPPVRISPISAARNLFDENVRAVIYMMRRGGP